MSALADGEKQKADKKYSDTFFDPKLRLIFPKNETFCFNLPKTNRKSFQLEKKINVNMYEYNIFLLCKLANKKGGSRSPPQLAYPISVFLCLCSSNVLQGQIISVVRSRSMTEKMFKEATKTSVPAQSYGLACMTEICLKKPKCVCQT